DRSAQKRETRRKRRWHRRQVRKPHSRLPGGAGPCALVYGHAAQKCRGEGHRRQHQQHQNHECDIAKVCPTIRGVSSRRDQKPRGERENREKNYGERGTHHGAAPRLLTKRWGRLLCHHLLLLTRTSPASTVTSPLAVRTTKPPS